MEEASDTAADPIGEDLPPVDLDQLLAEAEAISREIVDDVSADNREEEAQLESQILDEAAGGVSDSADLDPVPPTSGLLDESESTSESASESESPDLPMSPEGSGDTFEDAIPADAELIPSEEFESTLVIDESKAANDAIVEPESETADSVASGEPISALHPAAPASEPRATEEFSIEEQVSEDTTETAATDEIVGEPAVPLTDTTAANDDTEHIHEPSADRGETQAEVEPNDNTTAVSAEELAAALPDVDPLQAVEQVEADAEELNDLLNDPDAGQESAEAAIEATGETEVISNAGQSSASGDADGETIPPDATADSAANDVEEAAVENLADAKSTTPLGEKAGVEPGESKPRKSMIAKVIGVAMGSVQAGKKATMASLNMLINGLVLVDRPFRNVSPGAKKIVGLVGLVTLGMGLAAWFLPALLNSNPFEYLDSGVATQ